MYRQFNSVAGMLDSTLNIHQSGSVQEGLALLKNHIKAGVFSCRKDAGEGLTLSLNGGAPLPEGWGKLGEATSILSSQEWMVNTDIMFVLRAALEENPMRFHSKEPTLEGAMDLEGDSFEIPHSVHSRGRIFATNHSSVSFQSGDAAKALLLSAGEKRWACSRAQAEAIYAYGVDEFGLPAGKMAELTTGDRDVWLRMVLEPETFGLSSKAYGRKTNIFQAVRLIQGLTEARQYGSTDLLLSRDIKSCGPLFWGICGEEKILRLLDQKKNLYAEAGNQLSRSWPSALERMRGGFFSPGSKAVGKSLFMPMSYGCGSFEDAILYGNKVGFTEEFREAMEEKYLRGEIESLPDGNIGVEIRREEFRPGWEELKGESDDNIRQIATDMSKHVRKVLYKMFPMISHAIREIPPDPKADPHYCRLGDARITFRRIGPATPNGWHLLPPEKKESLLERLTVSFTKEEMAGLPGKLGFPKNISWYMLPRAEVQTPLSSLSGAIQLGDVAVSLKVIKEAENRGWPVASIHDCFICPAVEAEEMASIVKDAIVDVAKDGRFRHLEEIALQSGVRDFTPPSIPEDRIRSWDLVS